MERVVRNNTRKSSLFKIQAQKNKFEQHLDEFGCCKLLENYPECAQYEEFLKDLTQTFIQYCFQTGEQSPFLKAMNYNGRNFGFSNSISSVTYRQWLPNVKKAFLVGQFNSWDPSTHPLEELPDGFFTIEITEKLREGEKVQLIVTDTNDKTYQITPPSCRIVNFDEKMQQFVGIYTKFQKVKQEENATSVPNCLLAYEIDIHKVSLPDVLKQLPNILTCKFNTVIFRNLFDFKDSGLQPSLINKFSLKITENELNILKDIIEYLNNESISILFQIDYNHHQYEATSLVEKGYLHSSNIFQFDLQNENVFPFLLSNLSSILSSFDIDGFKFANIDKILLRHECSSKYSLQFFSDRFIEDCYKESIIFCKMINMVLSRINPNAISYCTSKCFVPGLYLPLVEGGFGFNFTSQINGVPFDKPSLESVRLLNYFNCVEFRNGDILHEDLKAITNLTFSSKGMVCSIQKLLWENCQKQSLGHMIQFRRQAEYFVDNAVLIKSAEVCIFNRNQYLFISNHTSSVQTVQVDCQSAKPIFCSRNLQIEVAQLNQKQVDIKVPEECLVILEKYN